MSYEQAKSLINRGPSRPTLFKVMLPDGGAANNYLEFFCKTTAIPEVRFNTVAVAGQDYQGVVRDQPTAVIYGKPFTITVIERSDFVVYNNIRQWFDQVHQGGDQGGQGHKMNYYQSYVRDLKLMKYEQSGGGYSTPLTVNFVNAYPVAIGQIGLGTDRTDSYTEYNIDFMYEIYEVS